MPHDNDPENGFISDAENNEDSDDDTTDDLDEVAPEGYRVRRSREGTNWLHRAYNSVRIVDMDIIYANLEIMEALTALIAGLLTQLNLYMALFPTIPLEIVATLQRHAALLYSYIVMLYLDFMDHVFYPVTNLRPPPDGQRFPPKKNRCIDDIENDYKQNR